MKLYLDDLFERVKMCTDTIGEHDFYVAIDDGIPVKPRFF